MADCRELVAAGFQYFISTILAQALAPIDPMNKHLLLAFAQRG